MVEYIYKAKIKNIDGKKVGVYQYWYKPFDCYLLSFVPAAQKRREGQAEKFNDNHPEGVEYAMKDGSNKVYKVPENVCMLPVVSDLEMAFDLTFRNENRVGVLSKVGRKYKIVNDPDQEV